jgi:hypothetical protein
MPKKKKDKEEDSPLIMAIYRSIEARKTSVIKAIEMLNEEYYERLTEDDFGRAIDLLSDEVKASVFITVGSPMRIGMSALIRGKGYAYWGYAFAVVLMES